MAEEAESILHMFFLSNVTLQLLIQCFVALMSEQQSHRPQKQSGFFVVVFVKPVANGMVVQIGIMSFMSERLFK